MINLKIKKHNISEIILIFLLIGIISLLIILPQTAIINFSQGLLIWATKVLPALLPFFILTKLLSFTSFSSGIGNFLSPITQKLYGVGSVSGYIYIMSILSGYPVGAKLTADFFHQGKITSGQAQTISAFTSTSGPLFIIGTVGIGFCKSQKLGIIVLISHFIGAIINGFLYRYKTKTKILLHSQPPIQNPLGESMTSSITSIMVVGGFIAIFYMILQTLLQLNIFYPLTFIFSKIGISSDITTSIISGLIEVTTGASMLSKCTLPFDIQATLISFLVSFGGLSIHAQAFCFLKDFNMPYAKFLLQKITHAIISASVTFIIVILL